MTPVARSGISRVWRKCWARMRRITLVRHAQASFLAADYDNLCAKGETQARLLGKYWVRRGVIFQKAYSGPRVRQRETSRLVAEVIGAWVRVFPRSR